MTAGTRGGPVRSDTRSPAGWCGTSPRPSTRTSAIRARPLLLAVALLCTAPALPDTAGPGRPQVGPEAAPTPSAAARPSPVASTTARTGQAVRRAPVVRPVAATAATPPQEVLRIAIRAEGLPPDAVTQARQVPGVRHVAAIRVGRLTVGAGPDELTVASVDPAAYRPFAPGVVAETSGVWERLAEGELAVTHEHAQRLGLQLGRPVVLGGAAGVAVRVGALASNGIPPVAQAIAGRDTGARLGLDGVPTTLLVAVAEDADPQDVADRLGAHLGVTASVVPDPRAPTAVAPAPPQGDTVWDVLAACESSGDWHANTGNGYYGGLQFLPESWWLVGGEGMPHEAPREEQILRAERLLAVQGWRAWPVCSVRVGLRPPPGTPSEP